MIARGDLPPVDCAIFADTGAEPKAVYEWLAYLQTQLPFPVHIVNGGNIKTDLLDGMNSTGHRFASIPFFTLYKGQKGMGRRQCTKEYKVAPILRKVRDLHGGKRPKPAVEMLIGISMDEVIRMRPSRVQYIENKHPLIELGMTRRDCLRWLEERQYPAPPKSACTFCPYRSDASWAHMRDTDLVAWDEAVEVDRAIRSNGTGKRMKAELYLHRSLKPLEQVMLTPEERGQPDLFNNDCEGMCGV